VILLAFAVEIAALVFRSRWASPTPGTAAHDGCWRPWPSRWRRRCGERSRPRRRAGCSDPRRVVVELLVYFCGTAGLVAVTGSPTAWLGIVLAAVVALLARMTGTER